MNQDATNNVTTQDNRFVLNNALSELNVCNFNNSNESTLKVDLLLSFVAMMLKWNHTYNLTAFKKVSTVLEKHIIDSLAVIPSLDDFFKEKNITTPLILDVGSGAGLPGVVLAIMRPNYQICCVDAVEKKTAFISAVKSQLGLKNLSVIHARVERLASAHADIVISRAFASIGDFIELTQTHVVENGKLVAMKAKGVEEELFEVAQRFPKWKVSAIDHLKVPGNNLERCLVWLQKDK